MKTLIDNQMRLKLFLLFVLIFMRLDLFSQMIQNEIIVTPNLTANKLENCNIDKPNLYSGTVDDNIPIYEIKIKNFSLPISLSHNYNGFKPSESASWVGLGWNLRVGGSISRIINNKPDEDPSGYKSIGDMLNIPDPVNNATGFNSFISNLTTDQLKSFAEGWWDGLPDEFMVSVNDINAKFIQLRNGNFTTIPFKPIQISYPGTDQWIVQDESGNKYYFGKLTSSDTDGVESSHTVTTTNPDTGQDMSQDAKSKYVLRNIQLITGETIVFNYESESVFYDSATSETLYYPLPGNFNSSKGDQGLPFQQYCSTNTLHTFCRLTSIVTPYEKIYFKKGALRKDLNSGNSYPLGEIEVQNSTNTTIKGCVFYSSYMGSTASYSTCRLMLDSIAEYGSTLSVRKPSYSFSYEKNTVIPAYSSKSIDHWGYYNGSANSTLVPKNITNSNYNSYFTGGGDREPNYNYSKIGLLTQVKLPTSGNLSYQYEPNSYSYINNNPVNEIIYDNITYNANALYQNSEATANNSFTTTDPQTQVTINYFLRYYKKVGNTIPQDETPPYVRITKSLSTNNNVYYWTDTNTETTSGTVTAILTPGTYYIEGAVWAINQVANISVTYGIPRKDSNGNLIYNKTKLTGGHRVTQLVKQDGTAGGNSITQAISYTCSSDSSRSSGVLVNSPNYEYNYTKMNVDYSTAIPNQLPDLYYIARTSNSVRPLASDDSHINYSEVTSITNSNIKSISYFTSGINFQDVSFPRNASNISKSYERGLLTKELQFNNLTQQAKSLDYTFNFSRTENKNGIGGVYLVEYQHKNIAPALSTFKAPWGGKVISEWIPLESTTEQVDGVSTTNNYYYDNPVHAQVTRTKIDNTEEKYTYTLYSYDYSNTGTGDFIGEMKSAHVINKPIEKVTYIKDKISGNLYVVGGEIYTYKTGSHAGQIESIYRLNTISPIAISSFKFSNRSSIGEMPHVNNSFATFSLSNIDAHYSTEPEQKVIFYDSYNNPQELWSKNNTSITYLWSYNHQYPIAEIKNATYADVKAALGYDDTQIESLATNTAPDVSSIRTKLISYFTNKAVLVTTYTCMPLVGILTATAPNGVVTTYEYDNFYRLKDMRDTNGKIVTEKQYHYSNQ